MFVRNVRSAMCAVSLCCARLASAQQEAVVERPYDGIQAGLDAFRQAEEKRQAAVSQQLSLNDQMRFFNGYATSRGETIYYGYLSPAAMVAFGYERGWPGSLAVLRPWPYGPGDLYGYGAYYQSARQPIGQQQLQTGPNRWESHPVYDPPVTNHKPLPQVDSHWLDRTPYGATETAPAASMEPASSGPSTAPPPPAPRRGPREY